MRLGLAAALATTALVLAAGCGDDGSADARPETTAASAPATQSETTATSAPATQSETSATSAPATQSSTSAARGVTLKVVSSRYGKVVADAKGEALYLFTKDGRGKSQCYGACATAWPPFLTKGKPRAGNGITASRLGTVRRRDGKLQVTYRGQPLYYFVADKPGLILCQDVNEFGGDWLVVAPSGRAIR